MSGSKPFSQSEDFVYFGGGEYAANPTGMDDGEWSLDQVTLLDATPVN